MAALAKLFVRFVCVQDPELKEQLSAATAALVTQGNIEAEKEAARKREEAAAAKAAA